MNDKDFSWVEFADSIRGRFILSQALSVAIEKLEEVGGPMREISNIEDMQGLLDNVFPMYADMAPARAAAEAAYKSAGEVLGSGE